MGLKDLSFSFQSAYAGIFLEQCSSVSWINNETVKKPKTTCIRVGSAVIQDDQ